MLKLLKKEFMLAMHPVTPMMLLLSAMVLIPNYPYVVIFFYVTMAIFFTCLLGRENNDVVYSLNLPVAKADVVRARIAYTALIELIQMALMIPFTLLSRKINPLGNQAGMDANVALFGVGFLVYGLFNLVFYHNYYRDVSKVGVAFAISSTVLFVIAVLDVVSTYAVPFVRDCLDNADPRFLGCRIAFTGVCAAIFALLTLFVCKISTRNFARQDLH